MCAELELARGQNNQSPLGRCRSGTFTSTESATLLGRSSCGFHFSEQQAAARSDCESLPSHEEVPTSK